MVLVIDTSSARTGLALLRQSGDGWEPAGDLVVPSGRGEELATHVRELVDVRDLTGVAVALGPGSFTGVRVGMAYGLGVAMGRGIPLYGLGTLDLAAARAAVPATGVAEAGRGRVYFLAPGGEPRRGEASEVPREWPCVGWLRDATAAALRAAGATLLGDDEALSFAGGAARAMRVAAPVGYGTVRLRYMSHEGRLLRQGL
jgi:tRNA threonylcarbamoyladenosine biosynthesis protein TsaB